MTWKENRNDQTNKCCQTAWVEKLVQVKEGVSRFTLELVQDYDSESVQRVEIDLDAAQ